MVLSSINTNDSIYNPSAVKMRQGLRRRTVGVWQEKESDSSDMNFIVKAV